MTIVARFGSGLRRRGNRKAVRGGCEQAKMQKAARVLAARIQSVSNAYARCSAAPANLVAVNEQLVIAALQARQESDAAAHKLDEAVRSVGMDSLTLLPNRERLSEHFSAAIANSRRYGGLVALLFIDLDNFKWINDTLGHAVGDEVLRMAAHRLAAVTREGDMISRYGGDEFLILLSRIGDASDAGATTEKLIDALGVPCRMGAHVLRLSASIGISLFPADGDDVESLIDRADTAMYRAKQGQKGRGRYAFYRDHAVRESPGDNRVERQQVRPFSRYQAAIVQPGVRIDQLQEANGELVLAALSSRQSQVTAEAAYQHQQQAMAMVAHELRNPLTPILIAATMLKSENASERIDMQRIIEREVMHISRLIGDLVDVARAKSGKFQLDRRPVDMVLIAEQAAESCRSAMEARQQRFFISVPPERLMVDGDAGRLTQVLRNLLDNASKYTPEQGEIVLSVRLLDSQIEVCVVDSGIGIAPESLTSVFEPFVQEVRAVGVNGTGLGIGLAVVRELVLAHDGQVTAVSGGLDAGTRFVVTLPSMGPL
ncbi:sensory box-containing diguanylate cyclase/cyclic diguanylate phosphodiesterase [Lysobacter enzymogenes]|uniref:histidine kinase n=2 Tax=Lysobacter enzymogenes TaxID=69 RepID=A0A0S2DLE5_LYSEN|nr:sensory box-containing diguanylate cyclase/cyclic diguanylate phosphodiesterase [Lysobacter enzymogenes]